MSRLPYLRRDELTPGGQEVWDSIVGSRGAAPVTDQGALTGPFNAFAMLPSNCDTRDCSVARALEILGERWTLLIVRDALHGVTHYDDFLGRLGAPTSTWPAALTTSSTARYSPATPTKRVRLARSTGSLHPPAVANWPRSSPRCASGATATYRPTARQPATSTAAAVARRSPR